MRLALSTVHLHHIGNFFNFHQTSNIHIKLHLLGKMSIKTSAIQK